MSVSYVVRWARRADLLVSRFRWPSWFRLEKRICLIGGFCLLAIANSPLSAQSTLPQVATDWDLYMLRLVNRARTDPAGEDIRLGTAYGESPATPLAYDPLLGRAAENHADWMGLNRNSSEIDNPDNSGQAPDSFTHYETVDAQFGGAPAGGTPGFSGAGIGDRLNYVDYAWSAAGENILWGSQPAPIGGWLVDQNHRAWWNSQGHRQNLMNPDFRAFGHHMRNDDDYWAEQMFGRPSGEADNYLLGLIYDDKNGNGQWDPYDVRSTYREGVAGQTYRVFQAGTETQVGEDATTMENGAYSFALPDGTYDVEFSFDSSGLTYVYRDVLVADTNVDLGDLPVNLGDLDWDGDVDFDDIEAVVLGLVDPTAYQVQYGSPPVTRGDIDGDGDHDFDDIGGFLDLLTSSVAIPASYQVPEPGAESLLAGALLLLTAVAPFRRTA